MDPLRELLGELISAIAPPATPAKLFRNDMDTFSATKAPFSRYRKPPSPPASFSHNIIVPSPTLLEIVTSVSRIARYPPSLPALFFPPDAPIIIPKIGVPFIREVALRRIAPPLPFCALFDWNCVSAHWNEISRTYMAPPPSPIAELEIKVQFDTIVRVGNGPQLVAHVTYIPPPS